MSKPKTLTAAFVASVLASAAGAQTAAPAPQANFFALIDVGPTYYSSSTAAGGSAGKNLRLDTGIAAGNRFGWRGGLDIGNGLSAVAVLEGGFNAAKGNSEQGGILFGRQVFIGLKNEYGSLTMGRQYDFMFDVLTLGGYTNAGHNQIGAMGQGLDGASMVITNPTTLATATGTLGNRTYGARVDNAIKFSSANFNGLTFGALVGFGEVPGNQERGRTGSLGVNYVNGPFAAGMAYAKINQATAATHTEVWGLGAKYLLGNATLYGSYIDLKHTGTVAGWLAPQLQTTGLGVDYKIDARWSAGLAMQRQSRNGGKGGATQLTAAAAYQATPSTWLYVSAASAKDDAFGATAVFGAGGPSQTDSQNVFRLGVRQSF
jgi:predicted porin